MRLIDADKLPKYTGYALSANEVAVAVENAQTIDAVPVVRCKDCRWGRETCGNIECSVDLNLPPEYHDYEWFCPVGERRKQ